MWLQKSTVFLLAAAVSLVGIVGCGSGDPTAGMVGSANKHNVSKVASCYSMYQMGNNFKGPENAEELKAFAKENEQALEMMGIKDLDAIFTSERDNEAIEVRWGVQGSAMGCNEPVSFEKTGKGGVRLVGFANGSLEEVEDDETYDMMLSGKYKPAAGRGGSEIPDLDKNGNPK